MNNVIKKEMKKAKKIVELVEEIKLKKTNKIRKVDIEQEYITQNNIFGNRILSFLDSINAFYIIISDLLSKEDFESLTFRDVEIYEQFFEDDKGNPFKIYIHLIKSGNNLVFIEYECD
jgi:hypothetical protein